MQGGDDGSGSYEYLVFQKVLVAIARDYDLHPVAEYDDFELDDVLEPAETSSDGTRLFRRFRPRFPGSHPSLIAASMLNCSFVLRKGKPEAAVEREAAPAKREAAPVKRARYEAAEGRPDARGDGDGVEPKYKRSSKFARAR